MKKMLPIARSDIHVHLCRKDMDRLFGEGFQLSKLKDLTIPGQFASNQTLRVEGPDGFIEGAVVVGPERPYTQVEISYTNGTVLGIQPPLRSSGDLEGTPGCLLIGPKGSLELKTGVIAAGRHIHMHTKDMEYFGVRNGQTVRVRVPGPRGLVFEQVLIKGGDDQALEMHIDFDEGFAGGVEDFQLVELLDD